MVWLITLRELREIARDLNLVMPIIMLPGLLGVVAGITAFGSVSSPGGTAGGLVGAVALQQLPRQTLERFGNLPTNDETAIIMTLLKAVGIPLFWIIPVALTSSVAADSFVGEKERDTLEPLLASPIRDRELFAGKLLTAVIPAILGTWFGMGVFMLLVALSGTAFYPRLLLGDRDWTFSTLVIVPLMALLAAGIAALISTRVNSFRAAYQLNGLIVLPIILVMIPQTVVLFLITSAALLYVAGFLTVLDIVVVAWALRIFDRERLLGGVA